MYYRKLFLQRIAETAFDIVSPGPSIKYLRYYDRTDKNKTDRRSRRPCKSHPADIREGFTSAYKLLKEVRSTVPTVAGSRSLGRAPQTQKKVEKRMKEWKMLGKLIRYSKKMWKDIWELLGCLKENWRNFKKKEKKREIFRNII